MNKYKKYRVLGIVLFVLLFSVSGQAQRSYTMNFLSQVPQQSKQNPAYYTNYKSYVGIPVLSAIQVQINNDAFSIDRTFYHRGDTTVIDIGKFLSNTFNENNLGFDISADLLSFGFKIGEKSQVHLGLSVEGYANAMITKNTFNFLFRGPGFFLDKNETEILSGNSIDMNLYGALSVGFAHDITEKLSVGARVKILSGFANLYTESSDIDLNIETHDPDVTPYSYTIKPNIALQGSFANCPKDSNLIYALRHIQSSIGMPSSLSQNMGLGLDFGATYQINENFTVGASINDIGYINWNDGIKRIASQAHEKPFIFSGVGKLEDILNNEDFDFKKTLTSLADSAIDYLQLNDADSVFSSYRSKLRTNYNLSVFYNLSDKDQLGVMWTSQIGTRSNNSLTIAYTRMFGPNFSVCVNNAIVNGNVFNFGGGFALNAGPFQLYLILDKISSHRVVKMRAANVQVGMNIVVNRIEKDPNKRRYTKDYTPRDKTGYVNDRWMEH